MVLNIFFLNLDTPRWYIINTDFTDRFSDIQKMKNLCLKISEIWTVIYKSGTFKYLVSN